MSQPKNLFELLEDLSVKNLSKEDALKTLRNELSDTMLVKGISDLTVKGLNNDEETIRKLYQNKIFGYLLEDMLTDMKGKTFEDILSKISGGKSTEDIHKMFRQDTTDLKLSKYLSIEQLRIVIQKFNATGNSLCDPSNVASLIDPFLDECADFEDWVINGDNSKSLINDGLGPAFYYAFECKKLTTNKSETSE